jgi:endonuclease/exonuclease/phosphatase family metal-dependent hydrolase
MVFLCETRQKAEKVKRLRGRLGLRGFTGVDSDGLSGGLALFWCDQIKVEVQSQSERFIDVHVQLSDNEPAWRLTCVYGEPRAENRHNMWSIMRNLKTPWCVMGDFNEAMWPFEYFSATKRFETHMLAFRDMLETCELVDLGFSGLPYTYDNKRRGRANVKVRLDRVVADNRWRNLFADAKFEHKVSPCSDH